MKHHDSLAALKWLMNQKIRVVITYADGTVVKGRVTGIKFPAEMWAWDAKQFPKGLVQTQFSANTYWHKHSSLEGIQSIKATAGKGKGEHRRYKIYYEADTLELDEDGNVDMVSVLDRLLSGTAAA